jgi:hypothetical protein
MDIDYVKIVVFVPADDADKIRNVLNESGAGRIGNYDNCSFSTRGLGRFRGLEGSKPALGNIGRVEEIEEERIETICPKAKLEDVIKAVRAAHPYEEAAIDVFPLLNQSN